MKTLRTTPSPEEPEVNDGPAVPRTARTAPELSPATENLTAWDEPESQNGFRHQPTPLGDENIGSDLVAEGLEEADRESRLAARDELEEDEDLKEEYDPAGEGEDDYPVHGITS